MKIYKNSISDILFEKCIEKVKENVMKQCWISSSICWDSKIRQNITGSCLYSEIPKDLGNELTNELKKYLPEHDELVFQYYIWQQNAGIAIHNDNRHKFGATLYLNAEWNVNWGGLFVWYDSLEDYYEGISQCLIPKGKTLVVNDNNQSHLVTPVSPTSPEMRVTIQIWGK